MPFAMTVVSIALSMLIARYARSDCTVYVTPDSWQDAVGAYSTITFTEYPNQTFITTQYQDLGVTFTDGNDLIESPVPSLYVTDGAGLKGRFDDTITLSFSSPMSWLSIDYPGIVFFELYSGADLLYTSDVFGGSGAGFFTGLVSTEPFDTAIIRAGLSAVTIDNLYFGGVPAPATLPLLMATLLCSPRRRE